MISIREGTLERTKHWTDDSVYVLTDFDQTMTTKDSESSWSILSKSDMISDDYIGETRELFNYYAPYEIDESLDYNTKNALMVEWWNKHIALLVKYRVSEEVINTAIRDPKIMSFRAGAKEFLESMWKRKIPVLIISAGIGNFIEGFLKANNCYYDNIFIISNFIRFENGVAVGVIGNVIHSLNKGNVPLTDEIKILIKNRDNIILFGDLVADVRMAKEESRENALKIGFLEEDVDANRIYFDKEFDIVCTDDTGYDELLDRLSVLR